LYPLANYQVLGAVPLGEGVAENRRFEARGRLSPFISIFHDFAQNEQNHLTFFYILMYKGVNHAFGV